MLARRILAFAIDVVVILVSVALAVVCVIVFGLITLGLGFALMALLYPGTVFWIPIYYGSTLGRPASATIGTRTLGIELRTRYGAPCHAVLGAVRAVIFSISVSALSPLVLLVGVFDARRRLLHDLVLGTVVVNRAARAALPGPGGMP